MRDSEQEIVLVRTPSAPAWPTPIQTGSGASEKSQASRSVEDRARQCSPRAVSTTRTESDSERKVRSAAGSESASESEAVALLYEASR